MTKLYNRSHKKNKHIDKFPTYLIITYIRDEEILLCQPD